MKNLLKKALLFLAAVHLSLGAHSQPMAVDVSDFGRILRIGGKDRGDLCGIEIQTADLVGTPTPDLLVASERSLDFEEDHRVGRVDLFDGADLPSTGLIDLDEPNPPPRLTFFGEEDDGAFGRRIRIGDFDGDGEPDLAISAPTFEGGGEREAGRVYLFFGGVPITGDGKTYLEAVGHINAVDAHVKIDGPDRRERTGQTLEAGDFDGDGRDDLVVGSPESDLNGPDEGGRVYVVHGRPDWFIEPVINLSEALSPKSKTLLSEFENQIRVIRGAREDNRIGESLAVGNLNGFGAPDLLIGADHEDLIQAVTDTLRFLRVGRVTSFMAGMFSPIRPPPRNSSCWKTQRIFASQARTSLICSGITFW